ncbi:MAG TPA: imidazolonepropionase, partial [Firmicutes bacterium]|nr:imidazolonepropionase [Bacillota bacterium]
LIHANELVTIAGKGRQPVTGNALADPVIIKDGAMAVKDGLISAVGSTDDILRQYAPGADTVVVNALGKTVIPGFVDPHTHAVYAGSREAELAKKLSGVSYLDILKQGGGILSTVKATRAASAQELYRQSRARIRRMIAHGTTTVEIKSGYGLNDVDEMKQLQVANRLAQMEPINVVNTFMAAHAWPEE